MVTRHPSPPARFGDRVFAFLGLRLVVWLLAAKAFLPGNMVEPPFQIGDYHDEHGAIMEEETARRTIVDYHQVPAWNPWFCGGIGLTSTSDAMAPDFLFRVLFGTGPGRRVTALFFVMMGMEGTFRYARKNGASAAGGALAGVAFSCSNYFVSLLGWGWLFMFNFQLIPWIAIAFEEGLKKRWWLVAGAFFLAWLLVGGGTYSLPYSGLVLGLLVIHETGRALRKADGDESVKWYIPALSLAAMGVIAMLLSAVRLIPLIDLLATHTRGVEQKDLAPPMSVLARLAFSRHHPSWGAGAGEFYVGSYVFVLAIVAALFGDKRAAKFWVLALVFGVLACGEFTDDAPYALMRKLPLFSQLRFPIRMALLVALFVALAAGQGLTRLEDAFRGALVRAWHCLSRGRATPLVFRLAIAVVASGFAAYGAWYAVADVIEHDRVRPGQLFKMPPPLEYKDDFRQARGNRWDAHVWPFASRGTLHCFHEHKLYESPNLRGDLSQEEFGAPGTDTKVERLKWTPNEIVVRVRSTGPGRFLVNQNFAKGWHTDVGEVGEDGGLISVKVPAGEHVVTIHYREWRMVVGAIISGLTILAIAIGLGRRSRRDLAALTARLREKSGQEPAHLHGHDDERDREPEAGSIGP